MRMILAAALLACAVPAPAAVYSIDTVHSLIGFRIRHLVAKTSGRFTKYSGTINYTEGKPETWSVDAKIDPSSINTDNEKRDGHLRSADFFDVEKCPDMAFKSSKVVKGEGDRYMLHGDLTMHCVTKPVVLDLEIGGVAGPKAGFSARTKINRKDFGITWNKVLDAGSAMLGEDVEVSLDIEADEAKDGAKPAKKK
jgi:polyisoprenoid-binding protein YceI